MSITHSPLVVTSGLTFYYDMNNTKKSYKGKPVTNQYPLPTPDGSGNVTFPTNGTGTFKRIYQGVYGGYEIQPTDIVYRYDLGTAGCHYHGGNAAIGAGQYATFTFDYYVSQNAAAYPTTNYLANFENYGGGALGTGIAAPNSTRGIWQTVTFTAGPTSASGTQAMFLYPGGCGSSYLASSGYILYKNPQVIFGSISNETQAFTSTSRSTSQAVLDLSPSNIAITANSLTYNSDGTFGFTSASGDNLSTNTGAITGNAPRSIFAWVKSTTAGKCILSTGTAATSQAFNLVTYGSNRIGVMGYNYDYYPSTGTVSTNIFDGNWHYVGVTYDGTTLRTYVDSVQDNSTTMGAYATTGTAINIGKSNHAGNENYWNGSIGSVKFYNRVLSAVEIQQNFRTMKARYGV